MAGRLGKSIYATTRWRAVRRAVLDRDGWKCRKCGGRGRMEVHHRKPLAEGGDPFDMAGLESICRGCHIALTTGQNRKPADPEMGQWAAYIKQLISQTEGTNHDEIAKAGA